MAEPPLNGRRPGPSPGELRRRRLVALGAVVAAVAAVIVVVALALPHGSSHAVSTTVPAAPPKPFRVVFPEGFTRSQMAERVEAVSKIARRKSGKPVSLARAAYLAASRRGRVACFRPAVRANLEGFLFPATYDFFARTRSAALVHEQLQAFCENWRTVNLAYARSKNLTPYDVLTIASMVEREAAVASERPLVAAVIYNRLRLRMPLGIDAALRYGLNIPPTQSILESQLQSQSPYNTRNRLGLPPTPIANPGLASIRAAAHPARVGYLYYVRKPDTIHHFFTASAEAFRQYECAHGYGC